MIVLRQVRASERGIGQRSNVVSLPRVDRSHNPYSIASLIVERNRSIFGRSFMSNIVVGLVSETEFLICTNYDCGHVAMLDMTTDCSSDDWVMQAASQWLKLKRLIIPSVGEHVSKHVTLAVSLKNCHMLLVEMCNDITTLENWEFLMNFKIYDTRTLHLHS